MVAVAARDDHPPGVFAADFADGVAAYKQADYLSALVIFNEGVGQNDARAQFALGLMYENGEGLTADLQQALETEKVPKLCILAQINHQDIE